MLKEEYRDMSPDTFSDLCRLNARVRELEAELEKYRKRERPNAEDIFQELFEAMRGFAREHDLALICGANKKPVYEIRVWDREQQRGYHRYFTEDELLNYETTPAMLAHWIVEEVRESLNIIDYTKDFEEE